MDRDVTDRKLDALRRCLARLREKRPLTPEALLANPDLQDILALNLERAVQLSVDLAAMRITDLSVPAPETMGAVFEVLRERGVLSAGTADRMRKAVGFRNIAVHDYQRIDWQIVFNLVHRCLEDFEAFARELCAAPSQEPPHS